MPSTASTVYQDGIEAKLITPVTTSTSTGITVKVKQINGSTPTFPTAAVRLHVLQRTALVNKHEVWDVAAGSSQSLQTVTLGTVTRALSLSDGTSFAATGTAQSFSAGADLLLSWDTHDAAMTPKKDLANTFSDHQTIAVNKELRLADSESAIWDDGTDLNFKSSAQAVKTLSQLASLSGSNDKTKISSNDTTEGYLNGKLVAGAGITLTENSDGSNETLSVIASNTVATGHTGLSTVTTGGLLIGAGTSNMTIIGPGTYGQVPVSNGTTLAMGTAGTGSKVVYSSGASSSANTATSDTRFDTHTYTIPANDLVAGVGYMIEGAIIVSAISNNTVPSIWVGGTSLLSCQVTTASTTGSGLFKAFIYGTTTAGAASSVSGSMTYTYGLANNLCSAQTGSGNRATNGTLAIEIGHTFSSSGSCTLKNVTITRVSTIIA